MSRRSFALLAAVATTVLAGACYQDDTTGNAGTRRATRVLITDAPFPFDTVQSVDVYFISISASTEPDTGSNADSMQWVPIVEPHRQINLLSLQRGDTALLGEKEIAAAQYKAVRVIIDADSSAIRFKDGSQAVVRWGGSGRQAIHSFVEAAMDVPDQGADIVLDFDVGKSFAYDNLGDGAFDFFPWIRAVNEAATGSISGLVTKDSSAGAPGPVANATVSAWGGGPSNWYIYSTGTTDAAGHYKLAYLLPGKYIVGVDPKSPSSLASDLDSNVVVTRGADTPHSVVLSAFRGAIYINGASSMLVGHTNTLEAIVVTAQHQQDPTALVSWQNLDPAILGLVEDSARFASVTSKAVGSGRIVASSGGLVDTLRIFVAADTSQPAPRRP
ncbi:MAG TPA: DUF4382 domain-containing protein [Gemmatimonadales bacterium]|nr:DUF4382 domain-containing protein [Gemmatimonadales bacterium]